MSRRAIGATAAGLVLLVLGAGGAGAHSAIERSDPAEGAILESPPAEVTIVFTEPPDPELSSIEVIDAQGAEVTAGPVVPGAEPRALTVPLGDGLPDGAYTVSWRVVSAADGHVTASSFAFGVGVAPGEPSAMPHGAGMDQEGSSVAPAGVVGKTLLYAGLAILLAAAVLGLTVLEGRVPHRLPLLVGGALAALVGALLLAWSQAADAGVGMATFLGSQAGTSTLRLLVVVALTLSVAALAAVLPERVGLLAVGVGAALAFAARVTGGHAAAASPAWPQELLQWLHAIAASLWIGGLVLVLSDGQPERAVVVRYSRLALIAVAVVLITGVARAVNELGGPSKVLDVLATSYGITLAAKVALVVTLIGAGAWNRARSIPRLETDDGRMLRRVVGGEVLVAVGVFGLTGLLTSLAPPEPAVGEGLRPGPVVVVTEGSDFATTTTVDLTITPGTPGVNGFRAVVSDFDTGEPAPAEEVVLRLEPIGRTGVGATDVPLREDGSGTWIGEGTGVSIAGAWAATVQVRTGAGTTEVPLWFVTAEPDTDVSVSVADGQPDITTITLPGGDQLQAYVDPGTAGANQVHVTAFDPAGDELPLAGATIVAVPSEGEPQLLPTERFGPGHLVADAELEAGRWTFVLQTEGRDGRGRTASFNETIEE
jgi:copper transport protein